MKAGMEALEPYVRNLESLVFRLTSLDSRTAEDEAHIVAALNGQPGQRLRELVTLASRRSAGAFFTRQSVADQALGSYTLTLSDRSIVYDAACGMGDLLISCARRLPVQDDLATTVMRWGEQLRGLDVHSEFVQAARARLVLLAISRGVPRGRQPLPPLDQAFPYLTVSNALNTMAVASASHIVLNPPYGRILAPVGCTWGTGKVSQAALFLERCLSDATAGTRIVAILPDVLRTGSLYLRWRAGVEARGKIESIEVIGPFDAWVDVDVFVIRMVVGEPGQAGSSVWWKDDPLPEGERAGNRFDVHVGAVVPHRDAHLGRWHPYVYARLLPAWETFDVRVGKRRRFRGRTFAPPFVAVRRTSAPGDKSRALATIVVGQSPVAVENHLLVLKPRDGSLESCRQLLSVLRDDRTNRWLDERIRCRHLTVGAVRDLPWWTLIGDH